jgi:hypothetical protein
VNIDSDESFMRPVLVREVGGRALSLPAHAQVRGVQYSRNALVYARVSLLKVLRTRS